MNVKTILQGVAISVITGLEITAVAVTQDMNWAMIAISAMVILYCS